MRIIDSYSHRSADIVFESRVGILEEIRSVFNDGSTVIGRERSQEIKNIVSERFSQLGWADNVRVASGSSMTISFMKQQVGVNLQMGNVARTYADILKLDLLGFKGIIQVGVIVVASRSEAKQLGANYAYFERLKRELRIFTDVISTPLLALALSNDKGLTRS